MKKKKHCSSREADLPQVRNKSKQLAIAQGVTKKSWP